MKDYYDHRAPEYDDWYDGTGLFAERDRPGWHEELGALRERLRRLPAARTLDVACGTGYLTRDLAGPVVALDQSPRMLAAARARRSAAAYVRGDGHALPFQDGAFARVFTGHFYGHLGPDAAADFRGEARRLAAETVIVDAGLRGRPPRGEWQERTLQDGTRWLIYKRFFDAATLLAEMEGGQVLHEGPWFVATRHP